MESTGISPAVQSSSSSTSPAGWLGQRGHDVLRWPVNLVRDLPSRAGRLGQGVDDGFRGAAHFMGAARAAWRTDGPRAVPTLARQNVSQAGLWGLVFITRFFDLFGGPELSEILLHILTRATPLTDAERAAGASVLGAAAIRWPDVRIAQGGILGPIFSRNGNRAFTTWHTINLPLSGAHARERVDILVHELVHVLQFERAGSAYIVEAIHAQHTEEGYNYHGPEQLLADWLAGRRRYEQYNREQQAQIVQDYFVLLHQPVAAPEEQQAREERLACYGPCLTELWAGKI